ncbi:MAG: flippase [Chitinophagaceae bacterium]|nr:flippase [Chitinophagaceae bacterium]
MNKTQMGIWALFLTVTGIFEATKSNLLKNAHIKYVSLSDDKEERTMVASSSFIINAVITVFFIVMIFLFSDWLSAWFNTGTELASMLKWFVPGLVLMVFFAHLEAVQQSHLDFKGGFAGHLIRQLTFFIILLIYKLLELPLSLTSLAMYQSLSIALGTVVIYLFSTRYLLYQFKASRHWIQKILSFGGYIFGSGMIANIFSNIDQIMTGKFLGRTSAVADYNVAARINVLVDIPSYAASEIMFPKASRASVDEGKEKVQYLFEKMVAVLLAFTVPTALFIIAFPKLLIYVVAGAGYATAAPILQIYMIAGIIRPLQNQAANLINSIGKPKLVFYVNAIFLAAFLLVNYLCLLQFGFYGAAIGTLITSMINFVVWYFIMKIEINLNLRNVLNYTLDTYKTIYKQVSTRLIKPRETLIK